MWTTLRRRPGRIVAVLAAFAIFTALVLWFLDRRAHVYTNDARIAGEMIAVSSDVRARILEIPVNTSDLVRAGDVLIRLDDREARFRLIELEARLAGIEAEMASERARRAQVSAEAQSRLERYQSELEAARASVRVAETRVHTETNANERVQRLRAGGHVSGEDVDRQQDALEAALQELERARADVTAAEARLREGEAGLLETEVIEQRLAALRFAVDEINGQLNAQEVIVDQHVIRSPMDGIIDELFVDVGEHALPGFRVALMHNPDEVWVNANVKETQIRRVAKGAPVRVSVDAYPGRGLIGTVTRVSGVATSEFALLPNPNASGVFTKITQRIPVRVDLDPEDLALRPGMMVTIAITADHDG